MKIAILTEYYPSAQLPDRGAFIHARAQLYTAQGHEVFILNNPRDGYAAQEVFEGITIIRPQDQATAQQFIAAQRPDVVVIHFPYRSTFPTKLAATLHTTYPLVAWVHGYETVYTAFYGYHRGLNRLLSLPHDWLKLRYLRRFLSECGAVVYVSQWLKTVAERSMRYGHPRAIVIANPIDTGRFAPCTKQQINRQLRGISVRSLGPKYGLDIAIRAYAELANTDLTIVGTGPLEQQLRILIKTTGSRCELRARGYPHAKMPELLHQYDYFVAPSRDETQGVAMCEAMSCGLPVVATTVGGIPEFVRDGIDGYLVPPENPAALRAAIEKLVADPTQLRRMGQNGRQYVLARCDGQVITQRELQVLQEVAERFRHAQRTTG